MIRIEAVIILNFSAITIIRNKYQDQDKRSK
jgi:hypothetical protein